MSYYVCATLFLFDDITQITEIRNKHRADQESVLEILDKRKHRNWSTESYQAHVHNTEVRALSAVSSSACVEVTQH